MKLFSKKEIAEKLNISVRTIDRLIKSKKLNACKIGRSVRITQEQLDEFIQASVLNPHVSGNVSAIINTNY